MPIKVSRIYIFALTLLPCVEKLCFVPKGLLQTAQTAHTSSVGAGVLVSGSRCSTQVTGPTSSENTGEIPAKLLESEERTGLMFIL